MYNRISIYSVFNMCTYSKTLTLYSASSLICHLTWCHFFIFISFLAFTLLLDSNSPFTWTCLCSLLTVWLTRQIPQRGYTLNNSYLNRWRKSLGQTYEDKYATTSFLIIFFSPLHSCFSLIFILLSSFVVLFYTTPLPFCYFILSYFFSEYYFFCLSLNVLYNNFLCLQSKSRRWKEEKEALEHLSD